MSSKHRVEAYVDLLRRYRDVFGYYWQRRTELSGTAFKPHEAEFLPATLALQEKPVSPAGRWVARILMGLVAVLLLWSILGKIDIIANATGKIIPSAYTKTIASVDIASVKAIHVQEGQTVKPGDVLVELDASASDAERDKASGQRAKALLQVARAKAMIVALDRNIMPVLSSVEGVTAAQWLDARLHLEGQYQDFRAKLARIDGDIARFSQALPLAVQQEKDFRELAGNHDVSEHAYLDKQKARIDLEGQLADARNQRTALVAATRKEALDAWHDGAKEADATGQDALRADSHSRLLKLTAPVAGTVQQLAVHTIGGVVPAAQTLMEIVPAEPSIQVEATLENKDVGFLEEGQQAEVKVDAYEYTKYGTVPGRVTQVSRDAVKDEKRGLLYTVIVTLDRSAIEFNGHEMPLIPGMSVSVEIKTGTRRVIEYALSPLLQYGRETLHER